MLSTTNNRLFNCTVPPSYRLFNCTVPPSSIYVNDHSSNVVYLILSSKFKLQYVGNLKQEHLEILTKYSVGIILDSEAVRCIAYSFCRILDLQFNKDYCKGFLHTVSIIEKLQRKGYTDRNTMDFAAKPTGKAKEKYWMQQLRSVLPRRFNYGKLDEFKSNNLHINVTRKFVPLPNIVLKLQCYL